MKICWDNLEDISFSKNGKWFKIDNKGNKRYYKYIESCKECGYPFLAKTSLQNFCDHECHGKSIECENNKMYGRFGKNHPAYGNVCSKDHKRKLSKLRSGKYNPAWIGGYRLKNIPTYNTYAHQIEWFESVRRNKADRNILEVQCAYCGRWYIPSLNIVHHRVQILKGNEDYSGESRFYCSNECKFECPIYNKSPEQLMKEDAIRAGRLSWIELNREVQPELRQMRFRLDDYVCQRCGSSKSLHCHHLEGIRWEPLESADIDKCITLCKSCHKGVHKLPDCGYNDLKCVA